MPILGPSLVATGVYIFMTSWNEYTFAVMFTNNASRTIPVALKSLIGQLGVDWGLLTAGQEKFRSLIPMYTRDAQIIILVYDVTRKESFVHLTEWINGLTNVKKEDVIFVLVPNKIDLDSREVTKEEGEKYAADNNIPIFEEVSAKTGDGFSSLFYNKLFQEIVKKFRVGEKQQEVKNEGSIKINEPNKTTKQKGKCCGGNSQGSTIDKK